MFQMGSGAHPDYREMPAGTKGANTHHNVSSHFSSSTKGDSGHQVPLDGRGKYRCLKRMLCIMLRSDPITYRVESTNQHDQYAHRNQPLGLVLVHCYAFM